MVPKRTSRGKQKLITRKIEKEKDLYAAFTKRKHGLFNKCSELSTLCGASVDILMFSPRGKPFCYGDPSSESITRTSLSNNDENFSIDETLMKLKIAECNTKNDNLLDEKYAAEARRENLKKFKHPGWWSINEKDVGVYEYDQIIQMENRFVNVINKMVNDVLCNGEEINSHVMSTINELNGVNSCPTYVFPPNQTQVFNFDGASGSGSQALPNDDDNDN